jgi:hypothetical protein
MGCVIGKMPIYWEIAKTKSRVDRMIKADISKQVILVLLFLVILVSFLGTLVVLQMYATSPRPSQEEQTKGTIGVWLLPPVKAEPPLKLSQDSSTVSIRINKYYG